MERCVALFLGGFALLELVGTRLHPGYDGNVLWIDLRRLPGPSGKLLLLVAAVLLLWIAARPRPSDARRIATAAALGVLLLAAVENAIVYWVLLARGRFRDALPVPFSLVVVALLVLLLVPLLRNGSLRGGSLAASAVALPLLAVGFPLAQMAFVGKTDYRRPADAIVVFGARAYADGTPSASLADRVRTACDLFGEGLAPVLVVSGGPGDGDVHETEAMRAMAIDLGVPPEAILVDENGVNTKATVVNTTRLMEERGWRTVLAVSHAYHIPRIRMTFGRAGPRVFTVPARETRRIGTTPFMMAREVAAFWLYWIRDLGGVG